MDENKYFIAQSDFESIISDSKSFITQDELEKYSNFVNLIKK